jgi:hypothetical protein
MYVPIIFTAPDGCNETELSAAIKEPGGLCDSEVTNVFSMMRVFNSTSNPDVIDLSDMMAWFYDIIETQNPIGTYYHSIYRVIQKKGNPTCNFIDIIAGAINLFN